METMGLEPIHRICRTRMRPTTSSPRSKSGWRESNSHSPGPKPGGLPTSLHPEIGCGRGIRTPDGLINNQVPYRLAIPQRFKHQWRRPESNRRHHPYERCAPPPELLRLKGPQRELNSPPRFAGKASIINAPVGARTLFPGLKVRCFTVKASSA